MSRFVPRWFAGVFVIGSVLAEIAAAVEAPNSSARSSVCSADAGSLPVSKARLLAFGNYRGLSASSNVKAQRCGLSPTGIQAMRTSQYWQPKPR